MIVQCPRCFGKGEVESGFLGFGWRTCPRCDGSGGIEELPKPREDY